VTAPDISETPRGPACLLVADDLTGACDAAVQFAARGLPTTVKLGEDPPALLRSRFSARRVLAISTESRGLAGRELESLWGAFPPCRPARILFKKIDSTLRGSVGLELALAARAFGAEAVLISPAFPAMGRTVEAGWLRVNRPDFDPVEMAAYWRAQELRGCRHVETGAAAAAIASGISFVSVDACCDADLDAITAAGLASGRRILWAGSGGLAAALGRALRPVGQALSPAPAGQRAGFPGQGRRNRLPHQAVLFCIGSNHPVTVEQEGALAAARPTLVLAADDAAPERVRDTLEHGAHVLLRIPCGRVSPGRLRELAGAVRAPLALSGGDTASAVCRALGTREIILLGEITPGIPRGIVRGGAANGLPVATKSGGFGAPDALIRIADCFTCPTP
jgi:D-threonate/D-erythronate kinase